MGFGPRDAAKLRSRLPNHLLRQNIQFPMILRLFVNHMKKDNIV